MLRQTFHNPNPDILHQVRYAFPLYDGVAVNGYTISYVDTILKGTVKQRDDAEKTYQDAVDRGETAGLLESLPAGVFGVTLGNVPARADIVVEITYCGELKHDAAIDGLRYMLPTSIAPRYGMYPGEILKANTISKTGISITVDVDMAGSAIRKVQSPSHPIAVSMGELSTASQDSRAPFQASQASATLTLGTTELASDFILQLIIDNISTPKAILETHPVLQNQRAIMATFVPKFTLQLQHPEIVFIADQSGSMNGGKNIALVSALKVFLKSLPLGVRFNICAFGNYFKMLWPCSQAYNQANVDKAISFVSAFTASYGGTEILPSIVATFKNRLKDLPLEVMLLTDGAIWNESDVFRFVTEQIQDNKVDARVFALGIGADVSHTLVEGVARAGNGFAQFVAENEDIDSKVIRMLKAALYGHTDNYTLEVNYKDERDQEKADSDLDDEYEIIEKVNDYLKIDDPNARSLPSYEDNRKRAKSFFDPAANVDESHKTSDRYAHLPSIETPKLLQAPATIPPLFPFNRSTFYLLLGPNTSQKKVHSVTLRASSAEGPLELELPVFPSCNTGTTIHQLAAAKSIQDLVEGRGWLQSAAVSTRFGSQLVKDKFKARFDEIVEREGVRLGERFQVASEYTTFVAVEERTGKEQPKEVDVPPQSAIGQRDSSLQRSSPPLLFNSVLPSPRKPMVMNASKLQRTFGADHQLKHSLRTPGDSMMSSPSTYHPTIEDSNVKSHTPPKKLNARAVPPPGGYLGGAESRQRARVSSTSGTFNGVTGISLNTRMSISYPGTSADGEIRYAAAPLAHFSNRVTGSGSVALRNTDVDADSSLEEEVAFGLPEGMPGPASHGISLSSDPTSPPPQPSSAPMSQNSEMHNLIALQTFSGAWTWNDDFVRAIAVDGSQIALSISDNDAKATALAVAFLETKVAGKRDIWDMVVAKARNWLGHQLGLEARGVDDLIKDAAACL